MRRKASSYHTRRSRPTRIRRAVGQAVLLFVILVLLFLTMVPLANMVKQSLEGRGPLWNRFLANYIPAWEGIRSYIGNSLVCSISATIGVLFFSSMAGYVFARHKFPGKETLYMLILSLLMIPSIFTLIPSFMIINDLGLIDSFLALILPWISTGQVFGILVCRGYYEGLPEELFEAARMDGASEFTLYSRIAIPLSWPVLSTISVINLMNNYNDFLWPLLVIRTQSKQLVSVGLRYYAPGWGARSASYIIATFPLLILFSFGMRPFMQGITAGAIRA